MLDVIIGAIPQPAYAVLAVMCALLIIATGLRPATDLPRGLFLIPNLDKVLHATAYAGFAALVFRALYPLRASRPPVVAFAPVLVVLLPFLLGCLDETLQGYARGRGQDPLDLLADTSGALVACLIGLQARAHSLRRRASR